MKIKKIILVLAVSLSFAFSAGAKSYFDQQNHPARIIITGSIVNVRSGPSTRHTILHRLYRNNIVDCHGRLAGWYVIHLSDDTVGLVSGDYAKGYYPPTSTPQPTKPPSPPSPTKTPGSVVSGLSADEQQMLNLVNQARSQNGLPALKANLELARVARIKSQDMVDNNYFSHTSPVYGSPFQMMKAFGITYRTAGENLAANSTVQAAHNALMNSPGHRANILNSSYTEIGIGVVSSPKYGKMFTQMFIGR